MNRDEKWEKLKWLIVMVGYFCIGYLGINWITSFRTSFMDVSFSFEKNISFVPIFILGYAFVYVGVYMAYVIIDDIWLWRRMVVLFFIASTICYAIFLIFPVKMIMRPDISTQNGIFYEITKLFYTMDKPHNCFPSLHVTYPTIITLVLWRYKKTARYFFLGLVFLMAISVVLVKQHYIADIIAAFITSAVSYAIMLKTEPLWKNWFERTIP